jgi:hypothetical protein
MPTLSHRFSETSETVARGSKAESDLLRTLETGRGLSTPLIDQNSVTRPRASHGAWSGAGKPASDYVPWQYEQPSSEIGEPNYEKASGTSLVR